MAEFSCRPGECIDCCSYRTLHQSKRFYLTVTLSDLYRALMYENRVKGKMKNFYQIFKERCSGWIPMPSGNPPSPEPAPISKMPCHNVSFTDKVCKVHGIATYTGCALFPEAMFLPPPHGYEDSEETLEFVRSLDCTQGITISQERERWLKEVRDLVSDEMHITGYLLNSPDTGGDTPLKGFSHKAAKKASPILKERIKFFNQRDFMERLKKNFRLNLIMERYIDLLVDDDKKDLASELYLTD